MSTHDTAQLQGMDRGHHLHPFTDTKALNAKGTRIITRGAGVYIWDSEGNRLIDGGGVRVDSSVVSDKGLKLGAGTYVVQVGKRKFARVTLG